MLLIWDALLIDQPAHVKKAISKIESVVEDMAEEYELDTSELDNAETGEDLYRAIEGIMDEYLKENPHPKDSVTRADQRTSLLFNRFGVPGLRYWDNFSRKEMDERFTEYREKHPILNNGMAFSTVTNDDDKEYTSLSTAWNASWNDSSGKTIEDRLLRDVLDELQRVFDAYKGKTPLQAVKDASS